MTAARVATDAEVLREAADRLAVAGCETPRLDAEVLLAHALACDRAALVTRVHEAFDASGFWELVARRARREPVAYITGVRAFRHIELAVDKRVLIPRPETELLVEVGLGLDPGARVVDVGTGSGAVALALKQERPDLAVLGVDVSADAVDVARDNAARLGLDVSFVLADLLVGVGACDAVLANLPYVAVGAPLAPEIQRYEPRDALFAGPDGLYVIRRLVAQLEGVSLAAVEIGTGQADAVEALLGDFASVERLRDLAGIERVVVARR